MLTRGKKLVVALLVSVVMLGSLFAFLRDPSPVQAASWKWSKFTADNFCPSGVVGGYIGIYPVCTAYTSSSGDSAFSGITGPTDPKYKEVRDSALTWGDLDKTGFCTSYGTQADYKDECSAFTTAPTKVDNSIFGVFDDPDPNSKRLCEVAHGNFLCEVKVDLLYTKIRSGTLNAADKADLKTLRETKGWNVDGQPNIDLFTALKGITDDLDSTALFGAGNFKDLAAFNIALIFKAPDQSVRGKTNNIFYDWDEKLGKAVLDTNDDQNNGSMSDCNGSDGHTVYRCYATRRSQIELRIAQIYKVLTVFPLSGSDETDLAIPGMNDKFDPGYTIKDNFHKITNLSAIIDKANCNSETGTLCGDRGNQVFPGNVEVENGKFETLKDYVVNEYKPFSHIGVYGSKADEYAGADYLSLSQKEDPCGTPPGFTEFGKAIKMAICNLVDLGHTLAFQFLAGSSDLLACMTGIPNGQSVGSGSASSGSKAPVSGGACQTSGSEIGKFLVAAVPKELQNKNVSVSLEGPFILGVTGAIRIILNSLVLLLFIVIALSNITQISVSTYSIKKLVPGIVIGFLVANFAVFSVRALLEISEQFTGFFLQPSVNKDLTGSAPQCHSSDSLDLSYLVNALSNVEVAPDCTTVNAQLRNAGEDEPNMGLVLKQGALNIFIFVAAVMIFILAFLFVLRAIIFLGITPLAPLAFFGAFVPPFSSLWQKWWKTASGWIFMNVVAMFWIWLAIRFFIASNKTDGTLSGLGTGLVGYAFGLTCIFFAMKTPFSMAGEMSTVLNKWNSMGKNAWSKTGGAGLKWAGQNAGAELKSATGLIPGVARVKEWQKGVKEATEHRRHSWAEGGSAGGAKQARKREDGFRVEQENLKQAFQELDDKKGEEQEKLKSQAKEMINAVKADTSLTDAQKNAKITDIESKRDTYLARSAARYQPAYDTLLGKKEDLDKRRNSLEGLGYRGRLFAKSVQRKSLREKRQKEHETDEGIVSAVAERELKAGDSSASKSFRHLSQHMAESTALTQHANAEGQYAERTFLNESESSGWIREYNSESAAFSELGSEDEKKAADLASLEVFRHFPIQREGESTSDYNFRVLRYEKSKAIWKAMSREQFETGRKGPGNPAKIDAAIDALKGLHWQDVKGSAEMDNSRITDYLRDRAQGVGALSASVGLLDNYVENQSSRVAPDKVIYTLDHIKKLQGLKHGPTGRQLLDATDEAAIKSIQDYIQLHPTLSTPAEQKAIKDKIAAFTQRSNDPTAFVNFLGQYGADPHFALDESIDWRFNGSHKPIQNPYGTNRDGTPAPPPSGH